MANTVNTKISNLVYSQVPFFVRNDHPNFVTFLEKYYEYLEQNEKVINRSKNLLRYKDIDLTEQQFAEKLYATFMRLIPEKVLADKSILLKHIKDFYRAKGTEKATRFLINILHNVDIDFYYPKKDVLRASDGKWFIQRSLRINDTRINDVSNTDLTGLEKFVGTKIIGLTSNSSAIVERVDRFFENETRIDELILSNINGEFENSEVIETFFTEIDTTKNLKANVFGGVVNSVTIVNAGSGYQVGDQLVFTSNTGSGANAVVSSVTTGNILFMSVFDGGAGFQTNDPILFSGGGGSGANGNVLTVLSDGSTHPNSYNIVSSTISLEANTQIGNVVYSNLNSSNVNTSVSNAVSYWVYANTGPIQTVELISSGSNYISKPSLSVLSNTSIISLGILGKMKILDGGLEYEVGDEITFNNVIGGYGTGALANVKNVDSNGSITEVEFVEMPGHIIGGSGYDISYLPTTTVNSSNGTNANIVVTAILGDGESISSVSSTIGEILRIKILDKGSGYETPPEIDLTGSGDGNALANASVIGGIFSYPGRYLNDDGHISSYNFLQDRDFYQSFSYVIRSSKSISDYRNQVLDMVHPAGTRLFGEFLYVNEPLSTTCPCDTITDERLVITTHTYEKIGNTVNISFISHGLSQNDKVYLEYLDGGYSNVKNGIYIVVNSSNTDFFTVEQTLLVSNNTTGNVDVGIYLI